MLEKAGMGDQIVIPLISLEPEVTTEDLDGMLFRDELAVSTTQVGGNSNRVNNVRLSAAAINETIVNPGEIFSYNATVGPRTAERGYREAGAYVGNLLVTEIGGGICQTSSTTYLSVLKADLEVVERQPHNMTVGYLPLGSDATVNWGTIDLKFRNNTEYPIRIEADVSNSLVLTVRLVGTKLDETTIKITYTQISYTPYQIIEKEDEKIAPGESEIFTPGSAGCVVDTYKNYYDADNNLIETKLVGRSAYSVQDRIILLPIATDDPDEDTDDPDADPTDAPPTDAPPTDAPPTDAPPTDAPPTDAPPTDAPPTDAPPTGPPAE
jgi:vancomycin resistance protein YoaR